MNWGVLIRGRTYALVALLGVLGACASPSVVIKGSVPLPLIDPLPFTASLNYTDEFTTYSYQEAEKKRAVKSVDFGVAQVEMFNTVFAQMVNLVEPEITQKDLIIEPQILDFQYTAPRETKLKLYEVWLRYRLRITDSNDKEVADWVVKGYGKTPTALLTTASSAFNAATNVALRDVGAQLSIGFRNQPDIAALLKKKELSTTLAPEISSNGGISENGIPEEGALETSPIEENTILETSTLETETVDSSTVINGTIENNTPDAAAPGETQTEDTPDESSL